MPARFFDRQNRENPLNGTIILEGGAMEALIDAMRAREPFLAELVGDAGHNLLLGLGSADGCVQFSSVDGQPPYLMALRDLQRRRRERLANRRSDARRPWTRFGHSCCE